LRKKVTEEKQAIGRRIAQARREAGLTQKQLGQLAGVDLRSVQAWEQGQTNPYRRLRTLENILGRSGAWLLQGSEPVVHGSAAVGGEEAGGWGNIEEGIQYVLRAPGAFEGTQDVLIQQLMETLLTMSERLDAVEARLDAIESTG